MEAKEMKKADNWLGFSLNGIHHQQPPPFHLQDSINHHQHGGDGGVGYSDSSSMAVMPIDHDILILMVVAWRFENGDGCPKLEDFLGGGCYSTTAEEDKGGGGSINVNISPNSHYREYILTNDDIVESRDADGCYFSPPPPPPLPPPPCF